MTALLSPPVTGTEDASEPRPWWAVPAAEVGEAFAVDTTVGLDDAAVRSARAAHGEHRLPSAPPRPAWRRFIDQFRSLLVLVLAVGAGLALALGDVKDAVLIVLVIVSNAALGFVQETRADRSLAALEQAMPARARVRRSGVVQEIDSVALVPGDVVLLEAGERIPADGRWIVAVDLATQESALTGESMPVAKSVDPVPVDESVADRSSMGFTNTMVAAGRGELVVSATGAATEIGRLAELLGEAESPTTPLQEEIHRVASRLTAVAGGAVAIVFLLGFLRGLPLEEQILSSIALAVAAIPEGLPMVLTVTLAVGAQQLAKRRAIVRRLASVETLGGTSVICSDKTGTLTQNRMRARALVHGTRAYRVDAGRIDALDGEGADDLGELLVPVALCNESALGDGDDDGIGDPMELALLLLARDAGIDPTVLAERYPRVAEIPFDPAARFMATLHRDGDALLICVKGALDALLPMCSSVTDAPDARRLDATARTEAEMIQDRLGGAGLRVLAVATARVPTDGSPPADTTAALTGLRLVGMVGLADPPRPEAAEAIARCADAGIGVKMITGDHGVTAAAIARELGIHGRTLTGAEWAGLSEGERADAACTTGVFARVAPEHKVEIVEALQRDGAVVAMTGDGVNDAPALKRADIGVAMGITGTEVAKDAAMMVLTDDDFTTIVGAVERGRAIYDNIVKFVSFQLSTNLGAILVILTATALGWPGDGRAFFAPLALLWVNLIMDGPPALALGVDAPGPDTMTKAPRAHTARILDRRRFADLLGTAAVMAVGTLAVSRYAVATMSGPSDAVAARSALMALTTFVLFQLANLHAVRFPGRTVFGRHSLANWKLWAALGLVMLLQIVAVEVPAVQRLITGENVTVTLSAADWAVMIGVATTVLVRSETRVRWARRGHAR
jgi:Ca2+-transporting ATPase